MSSILKSSRITLSRDVATREALPTSEVLPPAARTEQAVGPADRPEAAGPQVDPAEAAERARAIGYEEGWRAGHEEGLLQARRAVEDLLTTAQSILDEATRWQQDQVCRALPDVVALATAIAERIVRRVVELDAEVVIRTLEEAIRQREASDLVRIAVNPSQVEAVRAYWCSSHPARNKVEIVGDASVAPGGCLLLARSSVIDAQIPAQLDAISRELRARRL